MSREYQQSKTPQPFSSLTALPKLSSLRPLKFSPNVLCSFSFYIPQKARTLTISHSLDSNLHLALYSAFSDSIYYFSHFLKIFHWSFWNLYKSASKSSLLNFFFWFSVHFFDVRKVLDFTVFLFPEQFN